MALHSIILTTGGLFGCGCANSGELGIGRDRRYVESPESLPFDEVVDEVVHSYGSTMIISEGRVFSCGYNNNNQLGVENVTYLNRFTKINLPYVVRTIASGGYHTIMITDNRQAYGLGSNIFGELGLGDAFYAKVPTKIPLADYVTDTGCCSHHTIFNCSGKLFICGTNRQGRLGIVTSNNKILTPTHVPFDDPVTDISCGDSHTIVNANGLFITGEFMFGPRTSQFTEIPLNSDLITFAKIPFVHPITGLQSGSSHVVIQSYDSLYTFGDNTKGLLGQGHTRRIDNIVKVSFNHPIDRVRCGDDHTIIYSEEDCYGFGSNESKALGIPDAEYVLSPTRIPLPFPVISNTKRFRNTKSASRPL